MSEASNGGDQHGVGDLGKDRLNTGMRQIEIIDVDAITDEEEAIQPKALSRPAKSPNTRSRSIQASNNLRSKSNSPTLKLTSSKTVPRAKVRAKQTVHSKSQEGNDATSNPQKSTQRDTKAMEKERESMEAQMTYEEYIMALPEKWPKRETQYSQFLNGAVILLAQHMKEKRRHIKDQLDRVSGCLRET
jgi:hypothetical protein